VRGRAAAGRQAGPIGTAGDRVGFRCGYRARAWSGDTLLAESDDAVRVEQDGVPPMLFFPVADVVVGAADVEAATLAPTDVDWLRDHVSFASDGIRVEVVDGRPGDDPRDVTSKRFPTWGDAADLVELLDVAPDGADRTDSADRFVTAGRADWRRGVVDGSQLLAQSIVAAVRRSGGRRAVSAHMVFARAAEAAQPMLVELDPIAEGRSFSSFAVDVTQDGRRRARGTVLLHATSPDVIRHSTEPPAVAGPYECAPYDMSVTGRDIRFVDDAYTGDPDAPVGPPIIDAWVRFRELPDDPALHAGVVAQLTGHLSIAAAMRPHAGIGQDDAHRSLSTAINAIAISFHEEVRADQWLLYRHRSTFAGGGMTHAECRVHGEGGALVASFSVDAMVQPLAPSAQTIDERRVL
jgi:acyl-CoA thioesterase